MFHRLWRWFGTPERAGRELNQPENLEVSQLSDAEYESLFLELLAGANEGWSRGWVQGFLDGKNIPQGGLVEWLPLVFMIRRFC
ncbi:MAG: hypothetical protein ACFB02_18705 [Mastigocoleus sp.]